MQRLETSLHQQGAEIATLKFQAEATNRDADRRIRDLEEEVRRLRSRLPPGYENEYNAQPRNDYK
ncbi:hypothetical protein HDU85_003560 [Gaertneriomyces sp. JEL0708]|nr:hypothetical protein HDU85_003560 [Gaertneriomyces sp. JEL0708]